MRLTSKSAPDHWDGSPYLSAFFMTMIYVLEWNESYRDADTKRRHLLLSPVASSQGSWVRMSSRLSDQSADCFFPKSGAVFFSHLSRQHAVKEENQEALQWIEDTEKILKHQFYIAYREKSSYPCEAKVHRNCYSSTRLLNSGGFFGWRYRTARFYQGTQDEDKPMVLTETHKATGIRKANIAGKPCRRQLKISKIVKIYI